MSSVSISTAEYAALRAELSAATNDILALAGANRVLQDDLDDSVANVRALDSVTKDLKDRTELTTDGASAYVGGVIIGGNVVPLKRFGNL